MNPLKSRLSKIAQVLEIKVTFHTICCRTVLKLAIIFIIIRPEVLRKNESLENVKLSFSLFFEMKVFVRFSIFKSFPKMFLLFPSVFSIKPICQLNLVSYF